MPRKSAEESVLTSYLLQKDKLKLLTVNSIPEGKDGKKFHVITSDGEELFCRIKKVGESQELPNQEFEILNSVSSENVVKPKAAEIISGYYIAIFPFIKGQNLEQRLRGGAMPESEIRELADTLISVVEEMDSVGAVHFDIKPQNIIVGSDGHYYLVDFGTARFTKKMRGERIFPARKFLPPEVLSYLFDQSDLATHRLSSSSDMYGVGAVLYSCITRRNISEFFQSSTDLLHKMPPLVRELVPTFDPVLSDLVDRLIAKEPAQRVRAGDAKAILSGSEAPILVTPKYLLKTKPGRGSEHNSVLDAIYRGAEETGVYWVSEEEPQFPKKTLPHNVIWETPAREDVAGLEKDLLRQHKNSVCALCVPGLKLENPVGSEILRRNLGLIDSAIEWRRRNATHLPLFVIITTESSLLNSREVAHVKDAYAAKNVDGIIMRVCVPNRTTSLNAQDIESVKKFIAPWAKYGRKVLFDGDLTALPLAAFGVTSLISKTYPRLNSPRPSLPFFARTPDGVYLKKFLSIISSDTVLSLRRDTEGKTITNCGCPYCSTLMQEGPWDRKDRRKHFIYTIPKEIAEIKKGGARSLRSRVVSAQKNVELFEKLTGIRLPHLQVWLDFLQRP